MDTSKLLSLVNDHYIHIKKCYLLHFYVSDVFSRCHVRYLGGPATVFAILTTASVGFAFSILSSSSERFKEWIPFIPTTLSVFTSILTGLTTFLNMSNRAGIHQQVASKYYGLGLKCRALLADPELDKLEASTLRQKEQDLICSISQLEIDSPRIPQWAYKKSQYIIQHYDNTTEMIRETEQQQAC